MEPSKCLNQIARKVQESSKSCNKLKNKNKMNQSFIPFKQIMLQIITFLCLLNLLNQLAKSPTTPMA